MDPKIRDRLRSLSSFKGNDWSSFSKELRQIYRLCDSERVSYSGFVDWINRSKKNETPKELLEKFEDLYSRLDPNDSMLLQKKCWLFLRGASRDIQREISKELEISDNGEIKEDWDQVTKTVKRIVTLEERDNLLLSTPHVSQSEEKTIDDLTRQLSELRLLVTRSVTGNAERKDRKPQDSSNRFRVICIWCDSPEHRKAECSLLTKALRDKQVKYVEGKLAIYDTGERIKLNFENGGMKKLVDDYYFNHQSSRLSARSTFSVRAENDSANSNSNVIQGSTGITIGYA